MTVRTFIYGSCVSRDTFERLPGDEFELAGYVARQSLISIGSRQPADTLPLERVESSFQRRMLSGDLAGDALTRLDEAAPVDLVLWDLTDERLGVFPFGDGWFTRTLEGIAHDFYLSDEGLVPFGSDQHFELWRNALPGWLHALEAAGLLERTLFLQVPWASTSVEGVETPMSFGLTAARANAAMWRYQRAIMDAAPLTMLRPRVPVHATANHQWGLAPFHYSDETYLDVVDQIRAAVGGWTVTEPAAQPG